MLTNAQVTAFNGWSMTSSTDAGSEGSDPLRFDLSIARLNPGNPRIPVTGEGAVAATAAAYRLSDCLLANNAWRGAAGSKASSKASSKANRKRVAER
jgi:hypothetical protein